MVSHSTIVKVFFLCIAGFVRYTRQPLMQLAMALVADESKPL